MHEGVNFGVGEIVGSHNRRGRIDALGRGFTHISVSFTGLSGEPMPRLMIKPTGMDPPHDAGDDMLRMGLWLSSPAKAGAQSRKRCV